MALSLLHLHMLHLLIIAAATLVCVSATSSPALFVLGDSLVDPGNNNYLLSLAKSNFSPYGMQFDTRMPTGRFTNGRVSVDYLASLLGLPLVPPYLDPSTKGSKLLKGVNFASAGAGIIDSTGNIFGERISLSNQVKQFEKVKQEITSLLGEADAFKLISTSVFTIIIGSNDYINNYLFKATPESHLSPQQFQNLLLQTYIAQLKRLYQLGVRKIAAFSIPPIGCIPRSLALYGSKNGECIQFVNDFAVNFNAVFKPALPRLSSSLSGLQIIYVDSYKQSSMLYNNPQAYGFTFNSVACCGLGRYKGAIQCLPTFPACNDYDQREFFDSFHPTDRANSFFANMTFFGGTDVNQPINLSQLASL